MNAVATLILRLVKSHRNDADFGDFSANGRQESGHRWSSAATARVMKDNQDAFTLQPWISVGEEENGANQENVGALEAGMAKAPKTQKSSDAS